MAELVINSKTYGRKIYLIDDEDINRLNNFGNGSGKWNVKFNKARGKFYAEKRTSKGLFSMHRFLVNAPKGLYVDHINGNTLDNRKANLRICSNGANIRNSRLSRKNKSGYRGISWDSKTKSWIAQIRVNYKPIWLGRHKSIKNAVKIRKEAELKYWDT